VVLQTVSHLGNYLQKMKFLFIQIETFKPTELREKRRNMYFTSF